ncbi:hypothetical protein F9L33_09110 [Amylibacter sp. SFDW26]|uniref:hypothetical protein n=1 Tax=Amylibacter sp. SFDW26 TaxID=2652722 RepID=UPI0012618079|nr:hypothetical protein [Amylibacter sp. SFDW26]KAB7614768.1 hypothetical protein F9L33_09110 [Amylibacter sp. SFDW26]
MKSTSDTNGEKAAVYIALALTVIWALGGLVMYLAYPNVIHELSRDQSLTALVLVGLLLPIILLWMAALIAKSLLTMRRETNDMRTSVEKMRKTLQIQVAEESETRDRWIQSQLAQITAMTKQTDHRLSILTEKTLAERDEIPAPRNTSALSQKIAEVVDENQANLPLPNDKKTSNAPITIRELIKALNFPDNEHDVDGFQALRRAKGDHTTSKLISEAQNVLTMLSQDGIYVDDLRVEKPAASAWRSFAKGIRGKDVAALGMVRDRTALTLANTRLKHDIEFRETVHTFLTQFDAVLREFEKTAENTELTEMGKTRSALAFMLLGRVSGAFNAR